MAQRPGRGSDQFPLRLPDGMREQLKDAANLSGRSMNTEIVHRLEQSFKDALSPDTIRMMLQQMLHMIIGERAALREELRRRVHAQIAARPDDSPIEVINDVLDPKDDRKMDIEHFGASADKLRKIAEYLQDPDKRDDGDGKEGG